nr:PfkB family carbohydrate kinase [uncultured Sellimonas sp.]
MKRMLLIHDLCSAGKAAMMNMIPVLSVMGIEVCPLPTMLLSTHTGGYGKPAVLPVPGEYLKESLRHFQREQVRFDCIFVGYLGNVKMAHTVLELLDMEQGPKVILDPIMGDHGTYYSNFDETYKEALLPLLKKADLMLPNLTEAAFLSGMPYEACQSDEGLLEAVKRLQKLGMKDGVITGIHAGEDEIGMAVLEKGKMAVCRETEVPYHSHGTGDLFDAVLCGALLGGKDLHQSALMAHRFVADCLREKAKEAEEERSGLPFERLLGNLV